MTVGRTEAFDLLNRKPPPSSLIGITPLSSIALQILLVAFIQVIAIVIVWQQYWYRPHVTADPDDLASHDNYAVFASSVFQYITLSVVFSKGAPYRKPIYTNSNHFIIIFIYSIINIIFELFSGLFLLSLIAMSLLTAYLVIYPSDWLADFLEVIHLLFYLRKLFQILISLPIARYKRYSDQFPGINGVVSHRSLHFGLFC